MKNIAFAWWWTWWHCKPIQALIEFALNNKIIDKYYKNIFWFGQTNSLEHTLYNQNFEKNQNIHFVKIHSWKLRREKSFKAIINNIIDMFKFILWFFESIYYLKKYKIWQIFCKWGYVALPVVIAWKILWIQIFTHESDTKAWLVNKTSSYLSVKNFVAFDNVLKNSIKVWQILSDNIIPSKCKMPDPTFFLIMWWSQGSQSLYKSILKILNKNNFEKCKFIIILWLLNKDLKTQFKKFKNFEVYDFVDSQTLWNIYCKTDIAITRAWTTSLEEMTLFNIKKIIIPIPRTHDQNQNAIFYKNKYNDHILDQNDKNFETKLEQTIINNLNYKKNTVNLNYIKSKIFETKNTIRSEMIKYLR